MMLNFTRRPDFSTGLLILLGCLLMTPTLCVGQEKIRFENVRINEPPPGIEVTAGYFEVWNSTAVAVSLVHVSSPDFDNIEMHRSMVIDGIAKMVPQDTITIPANTGIVFKPGDYHLMLFRPRRRLAAGESVNLMFIFSDATTLEVKAEVSNPGTETVNHDHHH